MKMKYYYCLKKWLILSVFSASLFLSFHFWHRSSSFGGHSSQLFKLNSHQHKLCYNLPSSSLMFTNRFEIKPNTFDEFECVQLTKLSIHVCVFNQSEDVFISRSILNDQIFEPDVMETFSRFVRSNPDWLIIDVGANIGQFSLLAAKLGNRVIAIEPFVESLKRLAKAALIDRTDQKLILLHNAISNRRTINSVMKFDRVNKGGQKLLLIRNHSSSVKMEPNDYFIKTILFDDVIEFFFADELSPQSPPSMKILIKIDVEGHEAFVFEHATKLFECFQIQIVLIEWKLLNRLEERERVERLLRFFAKHRMRAFNLNDLELPNRFWRYWPENIYLKRI